MSARPKRAATSKQPNRKKPPAPRREKRLGLVVTEGQETEPQYLDQLKQELARTADVVQIKTVPVGKDPLTILRKCELERDRAEQRGKSYNWVCCVVDVDQHATLQECLKQAAKKGIHVVVSNIKFEIWLLWHVTRSRGPLNGRELDQLVEKNDLIRKKHLSPRFPIEKFAEAIEVPGSQTPTSRTDASDRTRPRPCPS